MRSDIEVDDAFVAHVLRLSRIVRGHLVILSCDPGKSTGMCVDNGVSSFSVQGTPRMCVEMCADAMMRGEGSAHIYVREAPYTESREQMARAGARATPRTIWSMGRTAGICDAAAAGLISHPLDDDNTPAWSPMPSPWRSVIGLNRKKTATTDARTETNRAVHMWAEATSGRVMRTSSGAFAFDEANAFALAQSARAVINGIIRGAK